MRVRNKKSGLRNDMQKGGDAWTTMMQLATENPKIIG